MATIQSYRVLENGNIQVLTVCALFGYKTALEVTPDQWERILDWITKGGPIQDHLPDLTDAQRELLMTGIRDEDFDTMFAEEGL